MNSVAVYRRMASGFFATNFLLSLIWFFDFNFSHLPTSFTFVRLSFELSFFDFFAFFVDLNWVFEFYVQGLRTAGISYTDTGFLAIVLFLYFFHVSYTTRAMSFLKAHGAAAVWKHAWL